MSLSQHYTPDPPAARSLRLPSRMWNTVQKSSDHETWRRSLRLPSRMWNTVQKSSAIMKLGAIRCGFAA
jgi:hypothetical protein